MVLESDIFWHSVSCYSLPEIRVFVTKEICLKSGTRMESSHCRISAVLYVTQTTSVLMEANFFTTIQLSTLPGNFKQTVARFFRVNKKRNIQLKSF